MKTQWRYTLFIGFDGKNFEGSANLANHRTVEGEVISSLKAMGVADHVYDFPKGCLLQRSSRVDKGVSANQLVISMRLPAKFSSEFLKENF